MVTAFNYILVGTETALLLSDAASLSSPTNWKLEDKIGRGLDAIHGPGPGYQEQLATRVNRLLDGLKPNKPLLRYNWSLQLSRLTARRRLRVSRFMTLPSAACSQ